MMENVHSADITDAVDRAMRYIKGREDLKSKANQGAGAQYSDCVIDCGVPVARAFPQYKDILEDYSKWIAENDEYIEGNPYWSIRHVMALDLIGQGQKAGDIFSRLKGLFNDGKWTGVGYHLGWYGYGCIVTGENALLDKTLRHIGTIIRREPDKFHYFTAFCVWKAYEKTKGEQYRKLFLLIVASLKPFKEEYIRMASSDAHMGQALVVFCTAFALTRDEEYRELGRRLVDILLKTQSLDGSWNDYAGNTIMPAAGLTAYLNMR